MNRAITTILGFLISLSLTAPAFGLENTPGNRVLQADRYLAANPPEEIFAEIAEQIRITLPAEEQKPFIEMLTKHLNIDVLAEAMKNAMIKHFTADEICALADFYSMPGAKSAMRKMGIYMAEIIPVVQEEMLRAQQKAFASSDEESPATNTSNPVN